MICIVDFHFTYEKEDLPYLLKALYQMVDPSRHTQIWDDWTVSAFQHHPFGNHPPIDMLLPENLLTGQHQFHCCLRC